jgi:hypothetical protein
MAKFIEHIPKTVNGTKDPVPELQTKCSLHVPRQTQFGRSANVVIGGSAASIGGASYPSVGVALVLLMSLVLALTSDELDSRDGAYEAGEGAGASSPPGQR